MSDIRDLLDIISEDDSPIEVNDSFDLEIGEDLLIETGVVALTEDNAIIVEGDEDTLRLLGEAGLVEEEELEEGDVIKGRFPPKQQPLFPDTNAGKPADVRMIPSIDTAQLYKEFMRQINPRLIKNEDDFLTHAFNFLQGKKLGPVKPMVLYKMAEKMKQVHDASTQAGNMFETDEELAEVARLAGLNWNDPGVRAHFDKPTAARVASGETEPVDRTDYDTPPAMRDPMQGKPGFEKRRASLIKQGILKAEDVEENLGYNPYTESLNEGPADEPEHEDTDADDKRWDDKEDKIDEAKYQGREVPLGKPMAGDVKKSKVYVRKPNGKIVKVNFGDKKMKIKKSNPKRRKSFRARHNCKNPGPRWKARYWSCRAW